VQRTQTALISTAYRYNARWRIALRLDRACLPPSGKLDVKHAGALPFLSTIVRATALTAQTAFSSPETTNSVQHVQHLQVELTALWRC